MAAPAPASTPTETPPQPTLGERISRLRTSHVERESAALPESQEDLIQLLAKEVVALKTDSSLNQEERVAKSLLGGLSDMEAVELSEAFDNRDIGSMVKIIREADKRANEQAQVEEDTLLKNVHTEMGSTAKGGKNRPPKDLNEARRMALASVKSK